MVRIDAVVLGDQGQDDQNAFQREYRPPGWTDVDHIQGDAHHPRDQGGQDEVNDAVGLIDQRVVKQQPIRADRGERRGRDDHQIRIFNREVE